MLSLQAIMSEMGIGQHRFAQTLDELNVSDARQRQLKEAIAALTLQVLVQAGNSVVDDMGVTGVEVQEQTL